MNRRRTRQRLGLGGVLLVVVTVVFAIITLLGVAPIGPFDLSSLSTGLIQLSLVTGAIAVIIGVLNLLGVHIGKLTSFNSASSLYSGITIVTFIAVLVLHFLELRGIVKVGDGTSPVATLTLMDTLQVVIESALAGLLFFFLVYSAYRLLRRRVTVWGVIFLATLVVVLIGYVMPPGSVLANLRDWILRVPVTAGTRGLLIGVAIGTIAVGIRLLIGQNKLFRE